jgi:hypothetical protein
MIDLFQGHFRGSATASATLRVRIRSCRGALFALLDPAEIGVTLTDEFMMEADASVLHHPEVKSFSPRNDGLASRPRRAGSDIKALLLMLAVTGFAVAGCSASETGDCSAGCHGAISIEFGFGTCTFSSNCGSSPDLTESGGCPTSDPTAGDLGGCCAEEDAGESICYYGSAMDIATSQASCVSGGGTWTSGVACP